jgi:hypothetical protein
MEWHQALLHRSLGLEGDRLGDAVWADEPDFLEVSVYLPHYRVVVVGDQHVVAVEEHIVEPCILGR